MKKTIDEIEQIRKETKKIFSKKRICVCCGTGCTSSKSLDILAEFERQITIQNVSARCEKTGCFGFCAKGPIVVIEPEEVFYEMVKVEDVKDIVEKHIKNNEIVERLLPKENEEFIRKWHELDFYKKQKRIALRNTGIINPENIDEYIARDGYKALEKVLLDEKLDVINELEKSKLRGRGGAGFLTYKKWLFTKEVETKQKYVCCNADEGDPGAFMDRSILEGDPHNILEAMAIAAKTVGATKGYIYIRAEYPIAVKRLKIAIKQAEEYGLLGENILGTGFDFSVKLKLGAGAFVCGEETALINSIEGKRGEPNVRPPYPAVSGINKSPTLINNVETFANIPYIILNGGNKFSKIGTETSTGTKVFALGGNIRNVGLVEVPMGTTLREIIYDIGGGIPNNKKFKAAQTGGPSGGCIPAKYLDTKIDYESLTNLGSMMGSGGLIVMDEDTCMVNLAKFFLEFTVDESCGKCTPCRIGTKRMLEIITRITKGRGKKEDIDTLEKLAKVIKDTSLCGLGKSAPNPVISTLKYFREEYEKHIIEKVCDAKECKDLLKYNIKEDYCRKCGICQRNCPVNAIEGVIGKEPFKIDTNKCIKCGVCMSKCPFGAVIKK